MDSGTLVVCTTVRNCGAYLPTIFENINKLRTLVSASSRFAVIISYDNCTDNSEKLIRDFKAAADYDVHLKHNTHNNSPLRTVRIANARNSCLEILYDKYPKATYHIMLDADDVNAKPYNVEVIKRYLDNPHWDCLSFCNNNYYDIWALLYEPIKHHCWGYNNSRPVVNFMAREIVGHLHALADGELYTCISAFNGFAIYRTPKFKYMRYSGALADILELFTDEDRDATLTYLKDRMGDQSIALIPSVFAGQCCEHIYYHVKATRRHGARICISKDTIFI